ncbi:MAG: FeS-binding protein [Desulfobacteraceae bacterium]|nr:MAG: FeS-binding protein [Desulfobacteraceae bacterium]
MRAEKDRAMRWIFGITMAVMAFTGFGQLPIFKRYYISAIPGMAWSADFYVTLFIHYLGAVLLTGLLAYAVTEHALARRGFARLTASGYVRALILAGIVGSGIFRVLKDLPGVDFSPVFTRVIDISHLGLMVAYGAAALLFWRLKAGWVTEAVPVRHRTMASSAVNR